MKHSRGDHRQAQLTSGPIGRTMIRLTALMTLGFFSTIAFNLVDTWFVARLGTAELAAMGFTFPVVMLVMTISIGLGVGTSALVSRAIGEGDSSRVQRLTTDALVLSTLIVFLFIVLGMFTIDPVFRLLGADDYTISLVRQYMSVWYPGMVFLVVPMVGNNAIRATGDMKWPSVIMIISVCINLVLDPILIFGLGPFPPMGLAGAAWATVFARACTLVMALFILSKRYRMLTKKRPSLASTLQSWRALLYIGIPAAASNLVRPLGMGVMTALVARYGTAAVAAYGVATRVDSFAFIVLMALATVLGPFVGQNIGAGNLSRVKQGIRYAQRFSLGWGALAAILFFILAEPIARIFSNQPDVVHTTVTYLRIVPVGYGLLGVFALSNAALNVLRRPWSAAALAVFQMFVLAVPAALLGSNWFGLPGIFGAICISAILAGITGSLWLSRVIHRHGSRAGEPTGIV